MNRTPSPLYLNVPSDAPALLEKSVERGLKARQGSMAEVFFRADDVGVVSASFVKLMELFARRRVPLNLAVVPAWISKPRWSAIGDVCEVSSDLWCWHQHGWRHKNHQKEGKNCEFGSHRLEHEIALDVRKGRDRLQALLGPLFSPIFTPPWNRCSERTLKILKSSGFKAVSRDSAVKSLPAFLPDFQVNSDLHTRRGKNPDESLKKLGIEFETGIRHGRLGIMIHHQRMNESAFTLLDELLRTVAGNDLLTPVNFRNLSDSR